ncbi:Serine/threonine-protein phosphatase 4 regulatory subunit 4 [Gracilaria domingensis]|nr:Serine/threonine-protein phosphatase 4 regulatory subunit 4 [Gracilaria domingensis]
MSEIPRHFEAFYSQYDLPARFNPDHIDQRESKYRSVYTSLLTTEPPIAPADALLQYVPYSIEKAGPGNYGTKQFDEGAEMVLLNDEILASVPNATLVLTDGNELERVSVLFQFPQFLEHCPNECINIMVPCICSSALEWSLDTQSAATEALFFVVSRTVPQHIAKHIAWASLTIASKTESAQLFDSCAELVSMVLPQLHRYDVLQLVAPDTIDRALSNRIHDRRLAARVIGSFNDALTRREVQNIFEDTALSLAQDDDPLVRSLVAQSTASIASYLPISAAEKRIWPLLKMLMSDDKVASVRAAALRALAKSAQAHSGTENTSPLYEALLKPIFLDECRVAIRVAATDLRDVDDDTYLMLEIFAEVYGHFLCSVSHLLNTEKESWVMILNTLRQMVTCNGPTVRHWCAFNMPAVVTVCAVEKIEHLNGIIPALAADSDVETRVTLAAGIHEIAMAHGALRQDVIRAINALFMDENAEVRMKVLAHFSELLILLSPGEKANHALAKAQIRASEAGNVSRRAEATANTQPDSSQNEMRRLKPMFTSLEMMSFDSWRTQKLLAEELRKSANLIPQEMLCEHVAPLLFQMARESTFSVRKSAMQALIYTVRYIPDVRRRNHILKHFRNEWARGKVYWTRLAYIEAAKCAREMFSSRLFTQLFKEEILSMYSDLVPNVRLRLVQFLSYVAPIWKEFPDFLETLSKLVEDKDLEVSREAEMLLKKLPGIEMPSAIEMEKDKALEAAESGFYVHRARKKRKVQSKTGHARFIYQRTKSGKVKLSPSQGEVKKNNPSIRHSNLELSTDNPQHDSLTTSAPNEGNETSQSVNSTLEGGVHKDLRDKAATKPNAPGNNIRQETEASPSSGETNVSPKEYSPSSEGNGGAHQRRRAFSQGFCLAALADNLLQQIMIR